jgi:DNA-binding HxlR family transcriptional regulator
MADETTGESDEENGETGKLDQSQNPSTNDPELEDNISIDDEDNPEIGAYTKPDEGSDKNLEKDEITNFLGKKGAVEILAQLSDGPKRFGEIDDAIVASHGTVSSRLTEGAKLGLWNEYFRYPDDGGKTKLYELSPAAESLADIAEEENIRETTEQLREIEQQHTDAVATFRDKIKADDTAE